MRPLIGKINPQVSLWESDPYYKIKLVPRSFYAQVAAMRSANVFKDEDFAGSYSPDRGRPSVPPSLLACLTLLQHYEGLSDEDTVVHSAMDLRWSEALGTQPGKQLCAKSTHQKFRAMILLHPERGLIIKRSIQYAIDEGLLNPQMMRLALDTKPIDGQGAVEDTFNLLAIAIQKTCRELAKVDGQKYEEWMVSQGLARFTAPSIKGTENVDWSDEEDKKRFLAGLVKDGISVLNMAKEGSEAVCKAAHLLGELMLQDVSFHAPDGQSEISIREGTEPDRIPSATDPEQRHGRKSSSHRFNGHKASVAVEVESQIITAVDVIAGNAGDATGALDLVKSSEEATGGEVDASVTDCAFSGVDTRQAFEDAGRTLIARVPKQAQGELYGKDHFLWDAENEQVTCPAEKIATVFQKSKKGVRVFKFGSACDGCPLRKECTKGKKGRTVQIHPQEQMLREAREYQNSPEGREVLRSRQAVEHALGRLTGLGIGKARYAGRHKTLLQLMIAAAIANFRRVWNWKQTRLIELEKEAARVLEAQTDAILGSLAVVWGMVCVILTNLMVRTRYRAILRLNGPI